MADPNKDTIYVDIDDEITVIIDKVRASSAKVVALVLPKRATTLQSIVNMKLLKRSADEAKKNLVLITTESGLLPLAGAVGLHVAKTPSSHPEIPAAPVAMGANEELVDEDVNLNDDEPEPATAANSGARTVGELAAATMLLPERPAADNGIETLELDNEDASAAAPIAASSATKAKPKKDKKLKVPDFDRFKMILIFGSILLGLLVVGGYFALVVMPKATIDVKTNASNVNTNVTLTLSTTATSVDPSTNTIPAKQVQAQKTYTGNAPATGQKNNGDKATGSITMSAGSCSANIPSSVPSGSGVSSGGKTYITQSVTSFFPTSQGNKCVYKATQATDIKAQLGGAGYNTDANATFSVSGRSDISATGSASGGTDEIQTIVIQADIENAKGKINTTDNTVQADLSDQLEAQGLFAVAATYNVGTPTVTSSANVGDAATSVTVTENVTYTMLGVKETDVQTLVDNDIKGQIDTSKQAILSRGITQAAFKLKTVTTSTGAVMTLQTVATVGPSIDTAQIAKDAAGKKSGAIQSDLKENPDVTEVTVKFSPFWVNKAPKNVDKITVIVQKPTKTADAN